jgi:hypothetical protein
MGIEERAEWLDAIHDLHRDCYWFRDHRGVLFSFAWYLCVEEGA